MNSARWDGAAGAGDKLAGLVLEAFGETTGNRSPQGGVMPGGH